MYPENPEETQVIVGSMNMGYISDTARNRTHNLFRPKCAPIPLGHSDGQTRIYTAEAVRYRHLPWQPTTFAWLFSDVFTNKWSMYSVYAPKRGHNYSTCNTKIWGTYQPIVIHRKSPMYNIGPWARERPGPHDNDPCSTIYEEQVLIENDSDRLLIERSQTQIPKSQRVFIIQ